MTMNKRKWRITQGDCLDVLSKYKDDCVTSIVTDPPYNLGFMNRPWDTFDKNDDAGFGYWLSGFVDGEGCFRVQRASRGTHNCAFQIKLRDDDIAILEVIKKYVGYGTITREKGDGKQKPLAKYVVQDKEGCKRIVDLFSKYKLHAKKRLDFEAWRNAVYEWVNFERGNRWSGSGDQTSLAIAKRSIENARDYRTPAWSGNDFQDSMRIIFEECFRVLKPGGFLIAFGGTRTYHRLTCAIEDAGFEIRDCLMWLYGSGFPKSHNVACAIDKSRGHPNRGRAIPTASTYQACDVEKKNKLTSNPVEDYAPKTKEAKAWNGYGTALKPAWEPIILARKPFKGTIADNVVKYGTGVLNIEECRVGNGEITINRFKDGAKPFGGGAGHLYSSFKSKGRWPANLLLDEESARLLDAQTSDLKSGGNVDSLVKTKGACYGEFSKPHSFRSYNDSGGASRFFYVKKASKKEREAGLSGERQTVSDGRKKAISNPYQRGETKRLNIVPTVKPIKLMRYLIRLVTPKVGLPIVLDPFCGSGSTIIAARLEGFRAVGIDLSNEYCEISRKRLEHYKKKINQRKKKKRNAKRRLRRAV